MVHDCVLREPRERQTAHEESGMSKIGVIAPTRQLYDLTQLMVARMGIADSVILRFGPLDVAVDVAKELEAAEVDVLVCRGGSAARILASKAITTPLVEIAISAEDLVEAIRECKRVTGLESPRIALVPFHGVREDLRALVPFLNVEIQFYPMASATPEIKNVVLQVVSDGPDVLLGGASVHMAADYGLPGVVLTSGESSLRIALEEALKVAYARRIEKERARRLEVVVELSGEGIVTLDGTGRIQIANPAAFRILGLRGPLAGRRLRDILPMFELSPCLEEGKTISDVLLTRGSNTFMASARPILVGRDVAGAVVTLQEAQHISDLENKIRKELFTKGLVATYTFRNIKGESPEIEECRRIAEQYAATRSTVLVAGETGTGKELFAQSIHNASPCRQGPFVAVNCAALPPSLLESELFGYEEGAFTGASRKGKSGLFELAQGGTIFLDEISAMDNYGQTRLLRILQERCIMRLGGGSYVPLDVRVLVASNHDLEEMVQTGAFRSDLYYRINLLTLYVPPLRERTGDIPVLVRHFAAQCRQKYNREPRFSDAAIARLVAHSWPGNVRELQNVVERLSLSSQSFLLDEEDVDVALTRKRAPRVVVDSAHRAAPGTGLEAAPGTGLEAAPGSPKSVAGTSPGVLTEVAEGGDEERARILRALGENAGNQKKAAEALGMDRGTLSRKMRRLGIRKTIIG